MNVGVLAGGAEHGRAIPASNSERSSRGSLHLPPAVHHCAARLILASEANECTFCERLRYSQKVPFGWRHSAEHGACRRQGAATGKMAWEVHSSRRKLGQLQVHGLNDFRASRAKQWCGGGVPDGRNTSVQTVSHAVTKKKSSRATRAGGLVFSRLR